MANALAGETSPYLLQHRDNPVDWRPWSPAAFAEARERDVPVLVSIGYSACHWCHVMERECFEDSMIAALMNERFVCVKVDREERPDVDAIYMDAVQAMTGRGGWPLNMFVTPDQMPFYGGTYFPPQPRPGMPSWPQVLEAIAHAWATDRDEIVTRAGTLAEALGGAASLRPDGDVPDAAVLEAAVTRLREEYDERHGGWGTAPKFPAASAIELLLRRGETDLAVHALRAMAAGGIYDQVGGGFARYAVDATWTVPHFEKMLYDNALLARAYLHGHQVTGDADLARVCTETLDWMLRELTADEPRMVGSGDASTASSGDAFDPDAGDPGVAAAAAANGFASSYDADSDGVEGRFSVWTLVELREALGPELAAPAIAYFGASELGNFEGANVLEARGPRPAELPEIRRRLAAARARRSWPARDDKRLTAWNALAIAALADAGAVLDRDDYRAAAVACAEFVLRELRDADGRLLRTWKDGRAHLAGYLEDHAFLLEALLTLYEATFDERWFTEARALADTILARFGDAEHGGFFTTADDHERLVARRKDLDDTPIPSGNASAAAGLLRLAALTGEYAYEQAAAGVLHLLAPLLTRQPQAFAHLLGALDFQLAPTREVALVGQGRAALEAVVRERFRPHLVLAAGPGDGDGASPVPLLAGRTPVDGRAAAYVCEHFSCRQPVTEPAELRALLDG